MRHVADGLLRAQMDERLAQAGSRRSAAESPGTRRCREPRVARPATRHGTPPLAPARTPEPVGLAALLARTGERVAMGGTRSEMRTLEAMAAAARAEAPGASAALVDWDGSEVARQRAFGIVHGVVLRLAPGAARRRLLIDVLRLTVEVQ